VERRQGLRAVLVEDAPQLIRNLLDGLFSGNGLESAGRRALQAGKEARLVAIEEVDRKLPLDAVEAARDRMLVVGPMADHAVVLNVEGHAAMRAAVAAKAVLD